MNRKLGHCIPNVAYDLPEILIRIRKLTKAAETRGLFELSDKAQVLLNEVKKDIESYLLLIQCEISRVQGLNNDNAEPSGL